MDEQFETKDTSPISPRSEVKNALSTFSPLERFSFFVCIIISLVALVAILNTINQYFLVPIPASGGTLSEGVIGTPRYVNPLLAVTDADRDLTKLVYRGLMKNDGQGNIVPDIAQSYSVSPDGLTYTFTLTDAYFEDGTPITANDVLFTVQSAQDPTLKSPKLVEWTGVMAKVIDPKTITFTLKQAYAPFLESTTLGILPQHIWGKIPYENWSYSIYNTKDAVGSGPYRIKSISQDSTGIPQYYELAAFRTKNGPNPLIDTIDMHFYSDEGTYIAAYENGTIDALSGIDPADAKTLATQGARILSAPLPRVFGLFFNQSTTKIFTDSTVRQAISIAINKDQIVNTVLDGYGETIDGPIPGLSIQTPASQDTLLTNIATAKKILEKDGWVLGLDGIYTKKISKKETDRLSFEIETNDIPELKQAVDIIVANLHAAGIEAIPKVYETSSLNQDIIRPRKFQALFFGEVVSNQADLFAFWDSSQRNDPGLNITGYANPATDKILETALATLDPNKLNTLYASFQKDISTDIPAVFVYSPTFIYAVRPGLTGITMGQIQSPEDRFDMIDNWYLVTDRVWKIFARK